MDSDRYRHDLDQTDRDIKKIDEAIDRIFTEEKRCQAVIDQRTRDLRNCKSESLAKSRQWDIDTQKKKIAELEKNRERRMFERKRLCRDREDLNKKLQYALQQEADARRREAEEMQRKEADRAYWEHERLRKEQKEQKRRSQADAYAPSSARQDAEATHQAAAEATHEYQRNHPFPFKYFIYVLLVILVVTYVSRFLDGTLGRAKDTVSSAKAADISTPAIMLDYIGFTVGDVERWYGTDYVLDSFSGGNYIIYTDESICPYSFLFSPKEGLNYDHAAKPEDTISGVVSMHSGATLFKSAKVGMSHQEFETTIGATYTAVMDEGADYDYPSATFTFHATLGSDGKEHSFTLVILEDAGYVIYAAIYINE